MPSTPVGGADQRRRAHDETRWVVTAAGAPPTVRVLDANAGTWGDGVDGRGSWGRERCEPRASDAGHAAITDAAGDPNQGGRDDRRALTAGIDPVRRDGGAAGPRVRAEGKSGVTACARSDLDADTRSRGAATGIVDLPTGQVRPATEGRATRVSVAAPPVRRCGGRPARWGVRVRRQRGGGSSAWRAPRPWARRVERVGGTSGGVRPRPGRRRAEGPAARVSAGRACPCRRRRAARRASHAPHGRLSACRVGTIRQPVIVVCVFAMRRSSDIGMVTYIAMVTDIANGRLHWDGSFHCDGGFHLEGGLDRERGVSAGRVCPVCRGGGPPAAAGRPGGSRHAQPIIVVCVFAMRRSSRHREGH